MTKRKIPKRKQNFFKRNYIMSLAYLKESRNFIYLAIGLFFFAALIGFVVPLPDSIVLMIKSLLKEILDKTEGLSGFSLITFIFFNNIQASFFGMLSGFFLGIFSALFVLFNGFILGFVSVNVVSQEGFLYLWRLLPHGVFELPAIFISIGLGMKFGTFLFQKEILGSFRRYLMESLRVFVFIVIPLLVVAAIIEGLLISIF